MIIDAILNVLAQFLRILLSPLEVINVVVDFLASMPVVASFIQVIAYLLPWDNLIPLTILLSAVLGFKLVVSLIHGLLNLIPFVR